MVEKYEQWRVSPGDLINITPQKARDLIITCFYEAQRETLARARKAIGAETSAENIKKIVVGSVQLAFQRVGADFENPTLGDLIQVVEVLAQKSKSWGTPEDIIAHHKAQIQRVLTSLENKNEG